MSECCGGRLPATRRSANPCITGEICTYHAITINPSGKSGFKSCSCSVAVNLPDATTASTFRPNPLLFPWFKYRQACPQRRGTRDKFPCLALREALRTTACPTIQLFSMAYLSGLAAPDTSQPLHCRLPAVGSHVDLRPNPIQPMLRSVLWLTLLLSFLRSTRLPRPCATLIVESS